MITRTALSIVAPCVFLAVLFSAYAIWTPGEAITDGRHDRGRNGIWIQHGWLGNDAWFVRNNREKKLPYFRNIDEVRKLAALLRRHGITDIFPHLSPASREGFVPPVDPEQTRRFLGEFRGFRVMPWIGGVSGVQVFEHDERWRQRFVNSVHDLLRQYPQFAGVHLNVEPCRSGNRGFLRLLEELRAVLPPGKILSVAAFPPPTLLHPYSEVHWNREFYQQVANRVDQLAIMMYDTALPLEKIYQWLLASWTKEVLAWAKPKHILLGLPAYDDAGVGYHDPRVENLRNALLGIHAGLKSQRILPENYQGIALYSEWEMEDREWATLVELFERAMVKTQ